MEDRALTAKELAYGVGVEPATGTAHLQRLLADSLVVARVQGRHKYFRLASAKVACCLEAMMSVAIPASPGNQVRSPVQEARFCYDHLAGRLAIELTRAFLSRKLLRIDRAEFLLTNKGERWCENSGIDLAQLRRARRRFAPQCLDWSERREHIGGALGSAIATTFLNQGWIRRGPEARVIRVTRSGIRGLRSQFGIRWR